MFLALDAVEELGAVDYPRCSTVLARDFGRVSHPGNSGHRQIFFARCAVRFGCVPITLQVINDPGRSTIHALYLR